MAKYSQDGRMMAVYTPLGKDRLLLDSFSGVESISAPFVFSVDLLWDAETGSFQFEDLIGQPMTIEVSLPDGQNKRFFHGLVSRLAQGAQLTGVRGEVSFVRYRAELVPTFQFLERTTNIRFFQSKGVPEILKDVMKGIDVAWELQGTYEPREYTVQYRESDFAFASRLMEEEGIYYYFVHDNGSHKMVVADTPQSHRDVVAKSMLEFEPVRGGNDPHGHIYGWEKSQEIRTGKTTLWDHSFELTGKNLEAKTSIQDSVAAGPVSHKLKAGGGDRFEHYDFPGGYANRFDGIDYGGGKQPAELQKIFKDNNRTAGIQMQREAARALSIQAQSDAAQISAGHKFSMSKHFAGDGEYVVKSVSHAGDQSGVWFAGSGADPSYSNTFEALPAALPYRPPITIEQPKVYGIMPGIVVGPDGDEICTDDYGRIKVWMPWDRRAMDENSSCWLRVATPWAGAQWGIYAIPRIGMEVIVAFQGGNPDYPVCVGCVYNDKNMPPYTLPDNRTRSGMKSRSTLKGDQDTFHELRFEDKKGEEEIYFHSEKDFNRVVENNDTLKVGFEKKDPGNRTIEVFNSEIVTIGAGKAQAQEGSAKLSIYKDRTTTLETGNDEITIKMGNETKKIKLGKSATEAMQSIELKVGQSSIKIDQTGVTIKGIKVSVEGAAMSEVKAPITQITGDGMCKVGGGLTMIG